MRRLSIPTITIAIVGLTCGLAYRYLVDNPGEASIVNYVRSSLHGIGIAATGWGAHVFQFAQ